MIETFVVKDKGYHPVIIDNGWQMAHLNYTEEQDIEQITRLDVHLKTDEVFVLIKGNAILIAADIVHEEPLFEVKLMKPNTIYNIPQNMWHNIAMEAGSEVFIAEKSNTHIADCKHFELNERKQEELKSMVKALFNSVNHIQHPS